MLGPLYVLGAGFSRAVSDSMPLMSELPKLLDGHVRGGSHVSVPDLRPFEGDLERWFSYLAIDQPWLSLEENLEKRLLYMRFAERLHEVIVTGEYLCELSKSSLDEDEGWWLDALSHAWATRLGTSIITFNYDLIVERAILANSPDKSYLDLYDTSIEVPGLRRKEPMRYSVTSSLSWALRVLKLHGSTNWGVSRRGADSTAPISLLATSDERGAQGFPLDWLREAFASMRPLLVPPVATKDSFFANEALAYQWEAAGECIGRCDEIVVIGYSFPTKDTMFRSMLSERLRGRSDERLKLTLVDLSDTPLRQIKPLLPDFVEVCTDYIEPDGSGLERYVTDLVGA